MRNVSLKILLIYSDQEAGRMGAEVTHSLRKKLGKGFQVAQSVWKTELLKDRGLRRLAAQEAKASDVVIVAASEETPLPGEVEQWFELWGNRVRKGPGAFVALLHGEDGFREGSVAADLHRMAEQARMEFFCHSGLGAKEPGLPRFALELDCEGAESPVMAP